MVEYFKGVKFVSHKNLRENGLKKQDAFSGKLIYNYEDGGVSSERN